MCTWVGVVPVVQSADVISWSAAWCTGTWDLGVAMMGVMVGHACDGGPVLALGQVWSSVGSGGVRRCDDH